MAEKADSEAPATIGYVKDAIGGLATKVDTLETSITANVNANLGDTMWKMFEEYLGKTPRVSPPIIPIEGGGSDTLANSTLSGEANIESGTNPKSSPGICAQIPTGEIYNNIHPIVSMPHINNMAPHLKLIQLILLDDNLNCALICQALALTCGEL